MGEIEEWFNTELNHLGFYLTPTIYDPLSFVPKKGVLYSYGVGRTVKLRTTITPELVPDVFSSYAPPRSDYKSIIMSELKYELENSNLPSPWVKDFTPKKILLIYLLK